MNKKNILLKCVAMLVGVFALTFTAPWLQQEASAASGWSYQRGNWYYYANGNQMQSDCWIKDNGTWYYIGSNGTMYASQWLFTGGEWYYLNGSGAMATGWVWQGGSWYYLAGSGAMMRGWIDDRGTWYYLGGNGAMYANTYTPDGYYVNSSGVWVQNYNTNQGSSQTKSNLNPEDYEPSWYNWTSTGYSDQDIDLKHLRAGKWESKDGNTVLYVDYPASPEVMKCGIYFGGKVWEMEAVDVDWDSPKSDGGAYMAQESEYGFRFKGTETGVMEVTKDGKSVKVYLERAKYGSENTEQGNSGQESNVELAYDKGYVADMIEYAFAYRPWLVVNRDGTFTLMENFNDTMLSNKGTFSISGNTLILKITDMDYGSKEDAITPIVKFKIESNGNLTMTYTETGISEVGTLFYINTR